MNFTKKIDRAFQWAGEKMGSEARTTMSGEFRELEAEMNLRYDGMERQQKAMSAYVKWLGRRSETFEDKEKGLPASYLARSMLGHGEEFERDSEFGSCLIAIGRGNERLAGIQERFVVDSTNTWLESIERSLAMMKEYHTARKKLDSRRLAYDTSMTKMQKAKHEDFRLEEELRTAKAKYEEASEDVSRRMQDIKDAETDSVRDLTRFLDAELDYHEQCAEELRRVKEQWPATVASSGAYSYSGGGGAGGGYNRRPPPRSRASTLMTCYPASGSIAERDDDETESAQTARSTTIRGRLGLSRSSSVSNRSEASTHPPIGRTSSSVRAFDLDRDRASTPTTPSVRSRTNTITITDYQPASHQNYNCHQAAPPVQNASALRGQLRPVSRAMAPRDDVFADRDDDTVSGGTSGGSPEWGERSSSPATSYGSVSRTPSTAGNGAYASRLGSRKAPPPPPPNRAKKPPPPLPAKREIGGY